MSDYLILMTGNQPSRTPDVEKNPAHVSLESIPHWEAIQTLGEACKFLLSVHWHRHSPRAEALA